MVGRCLLVVLGSLGLAAPLAAQEVRRLPAPVAAVAALAFRPDGRRLATAGHDHLIRVWNADGSPAHILTGHTAKVQAVAYAPDGHTLASAGLDGTLRLWDGDTGRAGPCLQLAERCVQALA